MMCNTTISEYQIDFISFSDLIVDMVKMGYISVSNFRLMRTLINNNCIHYAQLRSHIVKLFNQFYHPNVSYNMLQNVLNYYINSYLMSVFERSVKCNFEEVVYSVKFASVLGCEFASKSNEYVLLSAYDILYYYSGNWLSIEVPVKFVSCKKESDKSLRLLVETVDYKTEDCDANESLGLPVETCDYNIEKCDVNEGLETCGIDVDCVQEKLCDVKGNLKKRQNIIDEKGFKSFILPLQQDYTKSSEGYRLQDAVIMGKQKNNSCDMDDLDEFKYDGEFFENCTSSHLIRLKNTKITEGVTTLGSACTEMKCNDFVSSSDGCDNNASQMLPKNCDKPSHGSLKNCVDGDSKTASSEYCAKLVYMPLANLSCCNYDENNHYGGIAFDVTCEVEGKNDDSFSQDDDCADLISDDDDSDDSICFSDKIILPKQTAFSMKQFCLSPLDFDESLVDDDDEDEDYKSVSIFENFHFEMSDNHSRHSLSQEKIYTSWTPVSSEGYVNSCFENTDDDVEIVPKKSSRLKIINDNWNSTMKEFPSEPHESERVSFVHFPALVSVHFFEPDDDGYKYSVFVLDQMHFRKRISDFEVIMTPYLTQEHRANVYQKHFLPEN